MKKVHISLKSQFLIAMPKLMDPNFYHTVTVVCEHNQSGAMGVIINRPHPELTAKTIFDEVTHFSIPQIHNMPVFIGGSVNQSQVFVLHGPPFGWSGCFPVTSTLALTNTLDVFNAIAIGEGPISFLIIVGCSGWAAGQLEAEIMGNLWLNTPVSESVIFKTPIDEKWKEAHKIMGVNPLQMSSSLGHA